VQSHGVARHLDPYAHETSRVPVVSIGDGIGERFREGGAEVESDAAGGEGTARQLVRDQLTAGPTYSRSLGTSSDSSISVSPRVVRR